MCLAGKYLINSNENSWQHTSDERVDLDLSLFETMERTALVDRVLFWTAVFLPLFTAGLAFILRDEKVVVQHRHRWVLMSLVGPAILILWHVYNRVIAQFGLDSVKGLLVNVTIFAVAALIFTGLRVLLRALMTGPPPPVVTTRIPTQRFTTTRMRALNADLSPPPPPPPPPPPMSPSNSSSGEAGRA